MDLKAYSRDPNEIFSVIKRQNVNRHINEDNCLHIIEPKKNKYRNTKLKVHLNQQFSIGFEPYEILVDWYNCNLKLFYDSDDSLNNIPCYDGPFKIPCREARSADFYVKEIFKFLARGHSLHHPNCLCKFGYDQDRALELGLSINDSDINNGPSSCSTTSDFICPIENFGQRQSLHSIALELGINDIRGKIEVSKNVYMPLLDALIQFGGMVLEDGNYLSCSLCCIPHQINSADDIIAAAKATSPKPYVWNYGNQSKITNGNGVDNNRIRDHKQLFTICNTSGRHNPVNNDGGDFEHYSEIVKIKIKEELYSFQKKGFIRIINGRVPESLSIFFSDPLLESRLLSRPIDKDVRNLWFRHKLLINTSRNVCDDSSSAYYLEKGPSQMDIEKMLVSAGLKPMKTISKNENKKFTRIQPKLSQNKIKHRSMFINKFSL
jgi:hypothetical protein